MGMTRLMVRPWGTAGAVVGILLIAVVVPYTVVANTIRGVRGTASAVAQQNHDYESLRQALEGVRLFLLRPRCHPLAA